MHGRMMVALGAAAALLIAAACDREGDHQGNVVQEVEAPSLDPAFAAHLPEGVAIEDAARGGELYPTCGVCHGMEGEGTTLGPAFTAAAQPADSAAPAAAGPAGEMEAIARVIRSGAPPGAFPVPMPAYGPTDFTDEQVRSIAAYVFLLGRNGAPPE